MEMLMDLRAFGVRDLQNIQAVVATAIHGGMDMQTLAAALANELKYRQQSLPESQPATEKQRRAGNVTVCSVCGKQAVILPLSRSDRTPTATHAIQCQNRPATNQPWQDGMCGHTDYIVRGNK